MTAMLIVSGAVVVVGGIAYAIYKHDQYAQKNNPCYNSHLWCVIYEFTAQAKYKFLGGDCNLAFLARKCSRCGRVEAYEWRNDERKEVPFAYIVSVAENSGIRPSCDVCMSDGL